MAPKLLALDTDELVARYTHGASTPQLAKAFGCSITAISKRLGKAGVLRSQSEAERMKWARMSERQRACQVQAAHAANRGRHPSKLEQERAAMGRERTAKQSDLERWVARELLERGVQTTPQQAIGPYNLDLAAPPVAVEVFGGSWHFSGRHAARTPQRLEYLLRRGWHVLMLWDDARRPLDDVTFDHVVALIQQLRCNPAAVREYRMIRGQAETVAAGSLEDHELTIKPATKLGRDPTTGRYESVPR